MKILILNIVLYLTISSFECKKHSFTGYRLVALTPSTYEHLIELDTWKNNKDFDLWDDALGMNKEIKVLLSPRAYEKYAEDFKRLNLSYYTIHNNIQEKFDEQDASMRLRKRQTKSIIGKFARYNEIISFINEIVFNNPNIASSYVAGRTYENRELKTLVLKANGISKRSIWIDCGFHAREWISPSTCVWMIQNLINQYKTQDPLVVKLLNTFEIHILPLVNPDGYEYSHNTYRMWRKNRRPNPSSSCVGTDLNRNFGFQWMTAGASNSPCSDVYAGPTADSELETKAVQSAILKKSGDWDAYLTIHTYGNYWLTSWSYSTALPPDFNDILAKAQIGGAAITAYNGTKYTVGHSGQLFGKLAGVSDDWAKGTANIKYAYTLELAPGDSGVDSQYGFALPESRAPRVGEETYRGIKAFLNSII